MVRLHTRKHLFQYRYASFQSTPHYWWFANADSHCNRSFSYDRSFEDLSPRHWLSALIKRCLYFIHTWLRKILSIPSQVDITDCHQVCEDNTFSFSWANCSHNQLAFILPKTKSTVRYLQSFSGLASVRHCTFPQVRVCWSRIESWYVSLLCFRSGVTIRNFRVGSKY